MVVRIALLINVIVAYFILNLSLQIAGSHLLDLGQVTSAINYSGFWALGPFAVLAVLPVIRSIRLRQRPVLLLAVLLALTGSYIDRPVG
jgi:hypothetical protein